MANSFIGTTASVLFLWLLLGCCVTGKEPRFKTRLAKRGGSNRIDVSPVQKEAEAVAEGQSSFTFDYSMVPRTLEDRRNNVHKGDLISKGEAGFFVEWKGINLDVSGTYQLAFRYATKKIAGKLCKVFVQNTEANSVACPDTWGEELMNLHMTKGSNEIRVQAAAMGPNFEYMEIKLVSADPTPSPTSSPTTPFPTLSPTTPVPTSFPTENRTNKPTNVVTDLSDSFLFPTGLLSFDNFEMDWGSFTARPGTLDASRDTGGTYAYDGSSASLRIQDNSGIDSSVYQKDFADVSEYGEVEVSFQMFSRNLDTSLEGFFLEFSLGLGWIIQRKWSYLIDFPNHEWMKIEETIDVHAGNILKIRFRSDTTSNGDKIYIDDVQLIGK